MRDQGDLVMRKAWIRFTSTPPLHHRAAPSSHQIIPAPGPRHGGFRSRERAFPREGGRPRAAENAQPWIDANELYRTHENLPFRWERRRPPSLQNKSSDGLPVGSEAVEEQVLSEGEPPRPDESDAGRACDPPAALTLTPSDRPQFQKKLLLVVLALLALVILVRSRSWYARSTA